MLLKQNFSIQPMSDDSKRNTCLDFRTRVAEKQSRGSHFREGLGPCFWCGKMGGKRGRACVVVLGDIGRSPRMQYHALSLARQVRHMPFILCFRRCLFLSFCYLLD